MQFRERLYGLAWWHDFVQCTMAPRQVVPRIQADGAHRRPRRFAVGAPRLRAHVALAVSFTSEALLVALGLRVCDGRRTHVPCTQDRRTPAGHHGGLG